MNPRETYIRECFDIRFTGGRHLGDLHYGALERLLNEVGKTLEPKIPCIISLANRGAGLPDGGLFHP